MNRALETPRVRAGWEEPGIWAVQLCDQAGKNALDEPMVADLQQALEAAADPAVKVVVLWGLPEVFCSGAPAALLQRLAAGEVAPTDIMLSRTVLDVPVPTVAAMEGHAVGGGLALGCCADIILVARESRYGASFMNLGFTPGMGLTRLLEHVLSPAIAHELLYTGEFRKGSDFLGAGGFNAVLPRAEVRPRAFETAWRIADKPRPALEMLKRVLSIRRRQAFEETRTLEALLHGLSFGQAEVQRRIEVEYVQ
jgi:polyketide biosynthesis enoyl-CoA hydratase PksI